MNREVKELLLKHCTYVGSDLRNSNGDEITQWILPNGEIVEIIVLDGNDLEMDGKK
jgi:hypothetical protein